MVLFGKKKEEDYEDEDELETKELKRPKRIRDLNPENRKKRKEPPKPWGKRERLAVLLTFLATVITAGMMSASARAWKLPNLPRIKAPDFSNFFLFREETIVVGNTSLSTNQEKIAKIKEAFRKETDGFSGIYAFYLYDLKGDYFYGENYQEIMQSASLIKLPIMALTYSKAEKGGLKIDDYREYLKNMGKRSDNQAFLKMVDVLGRIEIQKYINSLGMSETSLEKNLTTPADIGLFFKKLYNNEIINKEDKDELLGFLTDTIFEDWLAGGIPEEIKVSHKYGREIHSVSDGGIVFDTDPFILVIMTDGVIETEADELFPKLSKLLYDMHTKDDI